MLFDLSNVLTTQSCLNLVHTKGVHRPHHPQFWTTLNIMCIIFIIIALFMLQACTANWMTLIHHVLQMLVFQSHTFDTKGQKAVSHVVVAD